MQFQRQARVKDLCKWADVPKSSHYYKSHPGPRGMKPTTHTLNKGQLIPNERVIDEIRCILGQDYCVYGYHAMTDALNVEGYFINDKKVHRGLPFSLNHSQLYFSLFSSVVILKHSFYSFQII